MFWRTLTAAFIGISIAFFPFYLNAECSQSDVEGKWKIFLVNRKNAHETTRRLNEDGIRVQMAHKYLEIETQEEPDVRILSVIYVNENCGVEGWVRAESLRFVVVGQMLPNKLAAHGYGFGIATQDFFTFSMVRIEKDN